MKSRIEQLQAVLQGLVFAAVFGAITAGGDILVTLQDYESIDWHHVRAAAMTGALMGVAAFWKAQVNLMKEPPK